MVKHYETLRRASAIALLVMLLPISMLAGRTIYLKTNYWWLNDNAVPVVYYYYNGDVNNNDPPAGWVIMTAVDGETDMLQATIPNNAKAVNFVRFDPNKPQDEWSIDVAWNQTWKEPFDNRYNQYEYGKNMFVLDVNGLGLWDKYLVPHTVYFMPNTGWAGYNPRFAVYYFNDTDNGWVDMERLSGEKVYKAEVPKGYEKIIFVRFDGNDPDNTWQKEWTQTGNLEIPLETDESLFYATSDDTDKYIWSDGIWYPYPLEATENLEFADDLEDIYDVLSPNLYKVADVTLQGRTLFKDGYYNTLCLPFSVTAEQLGGATIKTITNASLDNGVLKLTFKDAEFVDGGVPFLVKWNETENWENPTFNNVIIEYNCPNLYYNVFNADDGTWMVELDSWDFGKTYLDIAYSEGDILPDGKQVGDKYDGMSILFLGSGNTLYDLTANGYIGAFRAFFYIWYDVASSAKINNIILDLGVGEEEIETTGVKTVNDNTSAAREGIYTISGQRVNKPTKGLYIINGNKVIIK